MLRRDIYEKIWYKSQPRIEAQAETQGFHTNKEFISKSPTEMTGHSEKISAWNVTITITDVIELGKFVSVF